MMGKIRSYKELIRLETFEERFEYLRMGGAIGIETFGFDRYLNQAFYKSREWIAIRNEVILRDNGCDLAHVDFPIQSRVLIHHMNPISEEDLLHRSDFLLNPEFLITTTHRTHNAIHYGDKNAPQTYSFAERKPNDTIPWR